MSTDGPVTEALDLLRQRRSQLADELAGVDEAITALERLTGRAAGPALAPSVDRPSVRTMAVRLMEEDDRDWSTGEILAEYDRRGTPVHGKDPSNALRAALAEAKKVGTIASTGVGRYRAAKWIADRPETFTTQEEVSA